jgi:beta-glucuronidase
MPRCFQEHDQRIVKDLNGFWDFVYLGDFDQASVDLKTLNFNDRMVVPGCFDATPRYAGLRGLSGYRRWITIHDDTPHRLIFKGVNHWCRVFLDGLEIGDYAGGYTNFHFDLQVLKPGIHELIVLVDNRIDYERCPLHLDYFDWYHFGGITRDVEIHRLGKTWIDALRISTEEIQTPTIIVDIDYGSVSESQQTSLQITLDGNLVLNERIELAGSTGRLKHRIQLPGESLWSPDAPNLHMLHVFLDADDRRERIGIRKLKVEGKNLLLNNLPIQLIGFNRHESHPQFGCCQPDGLILADIHQLRDLGCNFVRGSHYPQDSRFLDLCDEFGICVWSEAIGWQHTAKHLTDPIFIDAQKQHIDKMIRAAENRPSVIIWGLLNESQSHDERSRPGYQDLIQHIRLTDPSRPITFASNHPYDDRCFDLVDIISINTYPGWYFEDISNIPESMVSILDNLDNQPESNKPVIISEIGAGAIPGWRDLNGNRWTEEYQAQLLEKVIHHLFIDEQRVMGLSIWLFNDYRTRDTIMRPRGFNNKGVVDEYRRPKLAYQVVKRLFRKLMSPDN